MGARDRTGISGIYGKDQERLMKSPADAGFFSI
jgi:hypothetical protein